MANTKGIEEFFFGDGGMPHIPTELALSMNVYFSVGGQIAPHLHLLSRAIEQMWNTSNFSFLKALP